jgi:cell division protein FtsB
MHVKQLRQGVLVGVLVVAAFWLMSLIWGLAGKAHIAIRQEREAKREYEVLETRKRTLEANLAELDTPRGQDRAIRAAFGVAKAGEEVIVVVPRASTTATSSPSWWQRVLDWF